MKIELEYSDGSIETFFANVPDGQRRLREARRVTLVSPSGARCDLKTAAAAPPCASLREYAR